VLLEELDWSKLEPMMTEIYTKTFTQREVDGIVAFYRSEAGAAVISKMPVALQEVMQRTQARLRNLMPRLQQIQREAVQELRAGEDKSPAEP
jgi:hypothetical protein